MRILVIGARGFIGSAVAARLVADGYEVVGAGRRIKAARERRPDMRWIKVDLARARKPENWSGPLAGRSRVVVSWGSATGKVSEDRAAIVTFG